MRRVDPRNIKPRTGKVMPELGDHQCFHCGTPLTRCSECKKLWASKRSNAKTCSNACRMHRYQRLHAEKEVTKP